MDSTALSAVTAKLVTAAIRGRRKDGQRYFTVGATGVSITHAYSSTLKKRALLLCAMGPAGKESEILGYDEVSTDHLLRSRVSSLLRTMVAKVEGATGLMTTSGVH